MGDVTDEYTDYETGIFVYEEPTGRGTPAPQTQ